MMTRTLSLILLVASIHLLRNEALATTYTTPAGRPEIRTALELDADPGDTVLASNRNDGDPDVAYWPFTMESGVVILAAENQTPIIDGADSVSITVDWPATSSSTTILRGFTIRGGTSATVRIRDEGVIEDCVIENESAPQYGMGIQSSGGTVIDGCSVSVSGDTDHYGIYHTSGAPSITNCTVDVSDGYGVYVTAPTPTTGGEVSGCTITTDSGSGLHAATGSFAIRDLVVSASGYNNAGLLCGYSNGQLRSVVENCLVSTPGGVGVWVVDDSVKVQNITVDDVGEGIYSNNEVTVTNCIVTNYDDDHDYAYYNVNAEYCIGDGTDPYEAGSQGTGSVIEDPLYCGGEEGTGAYTLRIDSYGNPENNDSGDLIGAYNVECAYGTLVRNTQVSEDAEIMMLRDVVVPAGYELRLKEGVTFKIDDDDNSAGGVDTTLNELHVEGRLAMAGAYGSPVTLGSSLAVPAAGDWYGIYVSENAVLMMNYGAVGHAVTGVLGTANADTVMIVNSTFDHNEVDNVYVAGGDTTEVTLSDNTFYVRGGVGVEATAKNLTISGGTVKDMTGDSLNGIELGATSSDQVLSGITSQDFDVAAALYVAGNSGEEPTVKQSTFKDSKYGVQVTTSDVKIGTTSSSDANTITGNSYAGILASGSNASPVVRYNNVASNQVGVIAQSSASPDLGSSGSTYGNNKITNSGTYCIWNRNSGGSPQVQAEGNYFGACTGGMPPMCWQGNVVTTDYLCSAPFGVDVEMVGVPDVGGRASLLRARRNPMFRSGSISFEISGSSTVARIHIYDIAGRFVRDLGEHEVGVGAHSVFWDGNTDAGTSARSGVYFVRLTLQDAEPVTSKLVMAR